MIALATRAQVIAGAMALALLVALPQATLAAAKTEAAPQAEITYDASQMDADGKTHVMHLKDVTITYGSMTVRADRALATAGDFKNSRWTLDGNVRINAEPRGTLRSDEAIVEFQDNQLLRATATGSPAEFDQKRADSNLVTHGKANEIVYEVGAGTVRLTSDAVVSDGQNDISGPQLVYSLRDERLEATTSPGTGQRVRVTILPNDNTGKAGGGKPKITVQDGKSAPQSGVSTASPGTTPDGKSVPQSGTSPANGPGTPGNAATAAGSMSPGTPGSAASGAGTPTPGTSGPGTPAGTPPSPPKP